MLLQCPQETRAPAGWGSGLAGPGWMGPRFIILLLEGDRQTQKVGTSESWDGSVLSANYSHYACCSELLSQGQTTALLYRIHQQPSHYYIQRIYKNQPQLRTTDQTGPLRCAASSQHVWSECKAMTLEVNSDELKKKKLPQWDVRNEELTEICERWS